MSRHDRRLRDLEQLLGAGDDAGCCRMSAAEYRAHLDQLVAARTADQPEPPLYLLSGGCTRTRGDLCSEAKAACAAILEHRGRLKTTTAGLDEAAL